MRKEEVRRDRIGDYSMVIFEENFVVKADHIAQGKGQTGDSTALALAIKDGCTGYPCKMTSFASHTSNQWTQCGEPLLYTHDNALTMWIAQGSKTRIRVRLDYSAHRLEIVHVFADREDDAEQVDKSRSIGAEQIEDNDIRRWDCCSMESDDWIECRDLPFVEYLCPDCVDV